MQVPLPKPVMSPDQESQLLQQRAEEQMKEAVNLSEIDEQSLSVLASTNRRNNNLPAPMSNQADHTKTIQMTTPVKNQNVQMHESPNTANVQNQHDTMGQFTLPQ